MTKKKKKRKKRRYFGFLDIEESPTAQDLWRETREQQKNQKDYWLH